MDLLSVGASLFKQAGQRLDAVGQRVASKPIEPTDVVDMKTAENEGTTAAKLIAVSQKIAGSLLDTFA